MGNSHSVPRDGGEQLSGYLRRLFKDKTNNVDELVAHVLKQEQKQKETVPAKKKGLWKRIKRRFKKDDKSNRNDVNVEEAGCNNDYKEEKEQCKYFDTKRNELEKWRIQEENVTRSARNSPTTTRGENVHYRITSSSTPRRFLRSGEAPIFLFHVPPKFDWRIENSNRTDVRDFSNGREIPWTHKDYGSDAWFDDNLASLADDTDHEIETDPNIPCAVKKTDREKKNNDVEHCVENIEEKIDKIYSEWTVFLKKTNDFYSKFEEIGDDFEQILAPPRQKGANRNVENNTGTQCSSTVDNAESGITNNRQPNTVRRTEVSLPPTFDCSQFVTNDDKYSPKKIEINGDCHQISKIKQNNCDINPAYIGLTRIERYLLEQKNAASGDGCDNHDITSSPVLEVTTQSKHKEVFEYPPMNYSKRRGKSGLNGAKRETNNLKEEQSNHKDCAATFTTDNEEVGANFKAAASSVPFDTERFISKYKDKETGNVKQYTQTENDIATRNLHDDGVYENTIIGTNIQTKSIKYIDIKTDTSGHVNKDREIKMPEDSKTDSQAKIPEAFFVSLGPSTFDAIANTSAVEKNYGKRSPSKADQHSEPKIKSNGSTNDNIKDERVHDLPESNVDKTQTKKNNAEAFFESFGSSTFNSNDHTEDVRMNFAQRFPNKTKQNNTVVMHDEKPIKTAYTLLTTTVGHSESDGAEVSLDCYPPEHRFLKRENKLQRSETQYGSMEHNNSIKDDNAKRKQRIQSMQTKVDSWKTNENDDPNIRNYTLASKPVEYGSVEHNNQIKRNNAMRKKKLDNIHTTLDCWKTKETDYSYLQPKMRNFELAPKQAEYGSVGHNNKIKKNNALRKMRIGKIHSTLDTWNAPNPGSKYSLQRRDEWEPVLDHKKYGTAAHFHQIKNNNSKRQKRLSKIQTNLDTWNAPNPGSKYSLQRRDEWEPVLDHNKYGTAAHFHQIKSDNSRRQKRLNHIQSNIDTWNTSNPGSKYSLNRKDEWGPVLDTRKYGSVAHYHQVRETHYDNRVMIKNARTKLSTWQPKSKMNVLQTKRQRTNDTVNLNTEPLNAPIKSAKPKIDSGSYNSIHNNHSVSDWSTRPKIDSGSNDFIHSNHSVSDWSTRPKIDSGSNDSIHSNHSMSDWSTRPKIDTCYNSKRNNHNLSDWSKYYEGVRNRPLMPVRMGTPIPKGAPRQIQY